MVPKVSIIIPVYGVEKYIEQCAHSLFNQTFQDIEFIFVDDCTKDNSISILQRVILDYPNRKRQISIIRKEKNEGLPQARLTGLKKSTGEYIIHIDSDDWVEHSMIELLYNEAKKNDQDIVWCDYYVNYQTSQQYINTYIENKTKTNIIKVLLSGKLHGGVWNKLVKKSIYARTFFPVANQREDLVITVQNIFKATRIECIPHALYHYRLHDASLTFDKERQIKRVNEIYENSVIIIQFLAEQYGNNLFKLEPNLSDFTNETKSTVMMHKATRECKKLHQFHPDSNLNIFNKGKHLPLYKKLLLYLALHDITFGYKIIDIMRYFQIK
jgi:glycosyltransferase involved in cell wall biosynthesis